MMKTLSKTCNRVCWDGIAPVLGVRLLWGAGEPIWSGSFFSSLLSCWCLATSARAGGGAAGTELLGTVVWYHQT